MRLDLALVASGLTESRSEAQELIKKGAVIVDGAVATKSSKAVLDTSTITVTSRREFVSRGGEKLEGVLRDVFGSEEAIRMTLAKRHALDIGSSTGGFTDCLLKYGVADVAAVDVGTSQLHPRLSGDSRIRSYENTDIRSFTRTGFDLIVADLSFISLEKVLFDMVRFGTDSAMYFILIKPQFEVGKGGTKKGIVKDDNLLTSVRRKYEDLAKELFPSKEIAVYPSKVIGGDGNQEYFLVIL